MKAPWPLILLFLATIFCSCASNDKKPPKALKKEFDGEVEYPVSTVQHGVDGYVELLTDIDANGNPENIRVLKSVPEGVFDAAAIKAVNKYRYQTPSNDLGERVAVKNHRVRIDFQSEGQK